MSAMSSYKKRFYQVLLVMGQWNERDRIVAVSGVLLGVLLFWFVEFYLPVSTLRSQVAMQSEEIEKSITDLKAKKAVIDSVLQNPDTAGLLVRYQELNSKIADLSPKLMQFNEHYISEKDLTKLLHDLLKQTPGLTIEAFSTIPQNAHSGPQSQPEAKTTQNALPQATKPAGNVPLIMSTQYRLIIRGTYFSVMTYLQHIEKLPWNIYWDKLDYQVKSYPTATATIEFYTLKPESESTTSTSVEGK